MRVIGMISGTSFDAVEAVLAELELRDDVLVCDLVEHLSVSYPPAVRDAIAAMLPPAATTIEQVCRLDVAVGQFFGSVAKESWVPMAASTPCARTARPSSTGWRAGRRAGRCSSDSRPGSPREQAPQS